MRPLTPPDQMKCCLTVGFECCCKEARLHDFEASTVGESKKALVHCSLQVMQAVPSLLPKFM